MEFQVDGIFIISLTPFFGLTVCPCVLCACPVRTTGGQEGGLRAGLSQAIMFSPSVFYRKKHNTTQHCTAQPGLSETIIRSTLRLRPFRRHRHRLTRCSPNTEFILLFWLFSPNMCKCQNWVSYYSSHPQGHSVLLTNRKHRKSNYFQNNLKALHLPLSYT